MSNYFDDFKPKEIRLKAFHHQNIIFTKILSQGMPRLLEMNFIDVRLWYILKEFLMTSEGGMKQIFM